MKKKNIKNWFKSFEWFSYKRRWYIVKHVVIICTLTLLFYFLLVHHVVAENNVFHEWPFTYALTASDFDNSIHASHLTNDENIIVQGIIDMLVRTPKGLVVIDFKTDRITAGQITERAGLYRRQLELYGRAASAILKSECIAKWLYFLTPRVSKEV